jgi:hypothetical protein
MHIIYSLNLMLTMVIGGFWHGAAWNYVLWGAYHGLLLVVFRPAFLRAFAERLPAQGAVRVLRRLAFFHLTCLGWALFRAESLSDCGAIFARLLFLEGWSGGAFFDAVRASGEGPKLALLTALIVGLVVVHNLRREDPSSAVRVVAHWPLAVRVLCVLLMLAACVAFAPEKPPPFIYFQF